MDLVNSMEETLILTNHSNKKRYVEEHSISLSPRKVMTFQELARKKYGDYDERAIYALMKKEHISYSIASLYLQNLFDLKEIPNEKVEYLKSLEIYLKEQGLLSSNPLFDSFLKRQKVFIYGKDTLSMEEKKLLEGVSYEFLKTPTYEEKKPLYVFEQEEEEVYFLAQSIAKKIKEGIPVTKIKILNLDDNYRMLIEKVFAWYHIPTSIGIEKTIYGTPWVKKILKMPLSQVEDALKEIEPTEIVEKVISIFQKYASFPEDEITRQMIEEELKRCTIKKKEEGVEEGDIYTLYPEDTILFLVGCNQGKLPVIHKEEDYFSDAMKKELGRLTSLDQNQEEKDALRYFLKHHPNVFLSYKKKTLEETLYPSSYLEEMKITEPATFEWEYEDSHFVNTFLLGKMLDNYYQYNVHHPKLEYLYTKYSDIPYGTYQNQYQKISKETLEQARNQKLLLSYSSLDTYYRCGFRYYVEKILKLNKQESTFQQNIGTLYHYVLSKAFLEDFNFDKEWDFSIQENEMGKNKKEKFFLEKLKEELKFIIAEIQRQYEFIGLKDAFYEEAIYTHPTEEENVTFMGIIDKLLYDKETNVVAVIDYKTGNPNLELRNLPYGLEMQLPIYLYLVNHFSKIKEPKIAGFYLQKILHNEIARDFKKTYEEGKRENLRLQGYSTSQEDILSKFDSTYQNSTVIKGLKTTSTGFYSNSKVLSLKEMETMLKMVEEKIKNAIQEMKEGNFTINPKRIGFENLGCEFCPYHDLCYHEEKDIVNLKKQENIDFLGGDTNA